MVNNKEIIGIFDLDTTTVSKHSRFFLEKSEKCGEVFYVTMELPKSFVICNKNKRNIVYISQLSTSTLHKRAGIK